MGLNPCKLNQNTYPLCSRFILIFSSNLCLGPWGRLFRSSFPTKTLYVWHSCHVCYVHFSSPLITILRHPSQHPQPDLSSNILGRVQTLHSLTTCQVQIFSSALSSYTKNLYFFCMVRNKASHKYKSNLLILCIWMLRHPNHAHIKPITVANHDLLPQWM
jgi:hypothetical protein